MPGHRSFRSLRGVALTALLLAPAAHADFTALKRLQAEGAQVTASVYDLDNRSWVQTLNPAQRLAPASVTKLALAAAALDAWPADKAFQTRLLGAGAIQDGTLAGDLVLQSDGDATLDQPSLWLLVAQLRGAGISAVGGRLLVNPSYGPLACDNLDRCQALERSDTAYNVPLAGIGIDYGTWCTQIIAGVVGSEAQLRGCGTSRLPLPADGAIRTVAASGKNSVWVERVTVDGRDRLRVGGTIPAGTEQRVFRAMSSPAQGTGETLRQMLVEAGIRIGETVSIVYGPLPTSSRVLAQTEGLALREQLGRMLRYSNNYIADLLTLNLGAARLPQPPTQLGDAAKALAAFVASTREPASKGAPATAPALFSGSGLTPENELSADDLIGLLAHQYRDTRNFPAFYGALVVPRQAPFNFVRQGNDDWLDRVTLKTGTMNVPRSVCGIAGYLRKKNGGWMAFAVIVNGGPTRLQIPLQQAMDAARHDIQDVLARY